ncbi:MAG TPA: DUF433 domain-containing protein [Blastocatellia bacterium]|nr:DUF433 domain-containing protein [Blastocatellia bacterium]
MGYQDRISRDALVCGGERVIKGTRVTIRTILASLAEGDSADEIVADFPSLTQEGIRAVIALAAAAAEDDLPVPGVPAV